MIKETPVNPIAFDLFGLEIRWYGIILASAILTAVLVALYNAKRMNLSEDVVADLALWGIPGGIIGARIYYVIFEWSYYQGNILEMLNIRGGGLAIHGGIIGGFIAGGGYLFYKKLPFWKYADLAGMSLIIAQAIGRWGNFMNNEAHGGPTDLPWGILVDGQKVHPTFLYESLWNLGLFAFLMWYDSRKKADGEVFCLYLMLYSVARFFIEGLRTDSLMFGPLRVAQILSLGLIIIFGILRWVLIQRESKRHKDAML